MILLSMPSFERAVQSSPEEKPLRSHPLEAATPGSELLPEEQRKLQLRSASPEEWEDLVSGIERIDESKDMRDARERAEAREKAQSEERARLRQERYEDTFLQTMRSMEQDPAFQDLSDSDKLSKVFEASFSQGLEILRADFPDEDMNIVGGRVLAAYGNFVANNVEMDPFKRVSALKAGDLMAKRIVERRKEAGLRSMDEPDRSRREGFREIRLGQMGPPTATFEGAGEAVARQASTEVEGGLINLDALQAREAQTSTPSPIEHIVMQPTGIPSRGRAEPITPEEAPSFADIEEARQREKAKTETAVDEAFKRIERPPTSGAA